MTLTTFIWNAICVIVGAMTNRSLYGCVYTLCYTREWNGTGKFTSNYCTCFISIDTSNYLIGLNVFGTSRHCRRHHDTSSSNGTTLTIFTTCRLFRFTVIVFIVIIIITGRCIYSTYTTRTCCKWFRGPKWCKVAKWHWQAKRIIGYIRRGTWNSSGHHSGCCANSVFVITTIKYIIWINLITLS